MDELAQTVHSPLNDIESTQIDNIVECMKKELNRNEDYFFNKSVTEYVLPNGKKIKYNYKLGVISDFDYNDKYIYYLCYKHKKMIFSQKKDLIKKIRERKVLHKYLLNNRLMNISIKDSESPDFLCIISQEMIGFEVALAISKQEAKANNIVLNRDKIKNIKKYSDTDVIIIGKNGFMPIQSSNIFDLVKEIPKIVNRKIKKISSYQKCDKYVILIEVYNPLIKLSDYKEYLLNTCKPKDNNVKVVLISENFEANEMMEIN